jgi:hypothetical protein
MAIMCECIDVIGDDPGYIIKMQMLRLNPTINQNAFTLLPLPRNCRDQKRHKSIIRNRIRSERPTNTSKVVVDRTSVIGSMSSMTHLCIL